MDNSNEHINIMDDETSREADICAVLVTFVYMDYHDASEGQTLKEILSDIETNIDNIEYLNTDEYQVLRAAVENDEYIANLQISNQSWNMSGFNSGTDAATFTTGGEPNEVYIAFKGTDDGEWIDNAIGMTEILSRQQEEAIRYYDTVIENLGCDASDNIYVTGHSKGGNKAQIVTLMSEYGSYIDRCYSLDGQGFSPEAIEYMIQLYGEDYYNYQLQKMYSINGEFDPVNNFGVKVIPSENTFYVGTPVDSYNTYEAHHIVYMFSYLDENGVRHFNGTLNDECERSEASKYFEILSAEVMKLPVDQRRDIAITIMQLAEFIISGKTENKMFGLYGEHANLENITGMIKDGIPLVIITLLGTEEGRNMLAQFGKEIFASIYEQVGPWGVAAIALITLYYLPIITVLLVPTIINVTIIISALATVAIIINNIIDFGNSIKDFCQDAADFITQCGQIANDMLNDILEKINNFYNMNLNIGYIIAVNSPHVKMDTYYLRDYANRLNNVLNRITNLDIRMDSIYWALIENCDIDGLYNLFKADLLTGYSIRLKQCANYFEDTASEFEDVEAEIISALGNL